MEKKTEIVSVIGCGTWGGAVGQSLAKQGYSVKIWHKFEEEVNHLIKFRKHFILDDLTFEESIVFSSNYDDVIPGSDIIVIAVPSHIVRLIIPELASRANSNTIFVNLAKGIENDSLLTMSQVISSVGGIQKDKIVTLYGPSHAEEVAKNLPTTLVSASLSMESAEIVQRIFSNPLLRIYTNTDILGVELGGSLKNVIAIAAGICDGVGYGDNTKAALLTRGITEMTRLGVAMGAQKETFFGLSGIGDLIATCLSKHSRNRFVGEAIGRGQKIDEILAGMNMVAEGVKTAKSIHQLIEKYKVDMPISSAIYNVIFNEHNPIVAVQQLMTRELVSEQ
ncbi:MAG: NAD(P)-dependent glycerol-3-phosphate dehydrogenase [Candidatus Marinimicrobia bacterium]|nr:NAD(P)-dependent glycerol-3-phosphate dehydrogenase [Candidatus Neomarinimicrobiota bacterium]